MSVACSGGEIRESRKFVGLYGVTQKHPLIANGSWCNFDCASRCGNALQYVIH